MNITFDKRLDLIFGLIYSASKDNNCNFRWAADMNPEYDEKFYQIYKKGITSEFENYIVSGGLDSYTRCVSIALSLNENYEVVENRDIQQIYSRNSIFNSEKLSAYLKEFVEKSHYEEFYASQQPMRERLIKKFSDTIDTHGEFVPKTIEDFYGYSKGPMNIFLANFSRGSYGMTFDDHISYVSGLALSKKGEFYPYSLSILFHEFSHPFVNPVGEKYFKEVNLDNILRNSRENGLSVAYNGSITLVNEYVVRAAQTILSRRFFDESIILEHIDGHKKEGFPYIEELIKLFSNKDNYDSFEEFYKSEIVAFFNSLNKNLEYCNQPTLNNKSKESIEIINKIDRTNLDSLLENTGQGEMSETMIDFANTIPEIKSIEDLRELDKCFFEYFSKDKNTKKFEAKASEIFERKTVSGCSDIGLSIAPILRYKGVPTIYVESANIEWIRDLQKNNENKELMRGHIFLEIFLNNKWYLYDPTFHLVYDGYDYENLSLPRDYYAFAKAMNSFEIGVHSVRDEKQVASNILGDFDVSYYVNPNYEKYDLRTDFSIENKGKTVS